MLMASYELEVNGRKLLRSWMRLAWTCWWVLGSTELYSGMRNRHRMSEYNRSPRANECRLYWTPEALSSNISLWNLGTDLRKLKRLGRSLENKRPGLLKNFVAWWNEVKRSANDARKSAPEQLISRWLQMTNMDKVITQLCSLKVPFVKGAKGVQ